jgi:hypothetical protein
VVVTALLALATISAVAGAVLGLLPTWHPESFRRESLALQALRTRGFRGKLSFPVPEWPPLAARLTLMGLDGFRPANFRDDPEFPENQTLRHAIGRPEDVDKIGWEAAAKLTWADKRYVGVAVTLLALSIPLTIAGLLY